MQGVEPGGFSPQRYFAENRWARGVALGTGAFFLITLAIALVRVGARYNSPTSKRRRTVEQNKVRLPLTCHASGMQSMWNAWAASLYLQHGLALHHGYLLNQQPDSSCLPAALAMHEYIRQCCCAPVYSGPSVLGRPWWRLWMSTCQLAETSSRLVSYYSPALLV